MNELVAQIMFKHEKDISVLLEDIIKLMPIVSNMGSQIKSLELELQKTKQKYTEHYVEDESLAPNAVNSTENHKENDDKWNYYEFCAYRCKANKNMRKQLNTNYETSTSCEICGKLCSNNNVLKEHKKKIYCEEKYNHEQDSQT